MARAIQRVQEVAVTDGSPVCGSEEDADVLGKGWQGVPCVLHGQRAKLGAIVTSCPLFWASGFATTPASSMPVPCG